jgi:opacity protein-like surface antigen
MKKLVECIFILVAPVFVFLAPAIVFVAPVTVYAQEYVDGPARAAATGPEFEASAGYTYLALDTPSRQRVGLSGVDANGLMDLTPHWGIAVDSSYARAGSVLGIAHSGNVGSLLAGAAFHPVDFGRTRVFVHTLAGISVVNSAVPVQGTYYLGGTVMRFSYAIGGGIERNLAGSFAIRVGGDYLRTTFANSNAVMTFQNNIRLVTSIVYRFGRR